MTGLAAMPMLAGASATTLAGLATAASSRVVEAGSFLMRAGEPAEALFLVEAGRLRVQAPDGAPLRDVRAGDALGELGALTGSARSADVVAVRDSRVLVVPQQAFLDALVSDPLLLRNLAELLARKVGDGVMIAGGAPAGAGLVALVALDAPADPWLDRVAAGIGATVLREEVADWAGAVEQAERAGRDVVVVCPSTATASWRGFCERTADRVVAVGSTGAPGAGSVDTVAVVGRVGRWPDWAAAAQPVRRQWLAEPGDADVLARRLARRSFGAVLSGGGARGLAHVGVLREWERSGHWPDRWGGASMGAFVAALAASGRTADQVAQVCRTELLEKRPFQQYSWRPRHAFLRTDRAHQMLQRLFGRQRIEDLPLDFFCVTADLDRGEMVVHREGEVAELVGASMSVPGAAPPVPWRGRLLVDGGVLDNLPVDVMSAAGEGPVVAVDVMNPGARVGDLPSLLDLLGRAMTLGGRQRTADNLLAADLVITPPLGGIGMFDFGQGARAVEAGRVAARAALPDLAKLLDP